ncbi:MAG TPA: GTP 3',8-cyclase MoaA [Mycobacteriales bacterium]|nr:GTP 3',8-cyclase MoaA [Mycobacteriales bacterium]
MAGAGSSPIDRLGRPLRDLRVSVTDRCNFRCTYCMPRDAFGPDHGFLPREQILSYEEIARLVRVFAELGVSKVRLTGGEPLLRRDLETLVSSIAAIPGIDDIALTTNGSLLAGRAKALRDAGLGRVTVSLDSVDPIVFAAMGDTKIPLAQVLDGIAAATAAGLAPVKLNAVIQRGVNDAGLLDLVGYAREHGHILRLIEFMDVGTSNDWRRDEVVPAAEIIDLIAAVHPLEPAVPDRYGEVARRWTYADGAGELGVITSVTQPFCTDCTRARITATGELFTCLFASRGQDLRTVLRSGASDAELRDAITAVWARRTDRYSELRELMTDAAPARAEMSYLGG